MIKGSVENHVPRAFTFNFGQLKVFSGKKTSSLPLHEPIHSASVFLLFSLRPETLPKSSKVSNVAESEDFDPSRTRVVSSAYPMEQLSH